MTTKHTGLFGEINKLRTEHPLRLNPLRWNNDLAESARAHSRFMLKKNRLEYPKYGGYAVEPVGGILVPCHSWWFGDKAVQFNPEEQLYCAICTVPGNHYCMERIKAIMNIWTNHEHSRDILLTSNITCGGTGIAVGKGKIYATIVSCEIPLHPIGEATAAKEFITRLVTSGYR